jgi:glucose dehydrogenase
MRNRIILIAISAACSLTWGADWPTDGANSQRTNFQPDEKILTKDNVKNLKILWKIKLDNVPQEMHSLFPPLIIEKVNTSAGVKQIALEAGISDNLYAIDVEAGKLLWKKHFEYPTPERPGHRSSAPRTLPARGTSTPSPVTASCIQSIWRMAKRSRRHFNSGTPTESLMP